MFRKDNKLIKSWQMNGPEYFAAIQKSILSQAAQMLKPGGYMLYSTCTFSKLEDEDNIQLFLESHPDFRLSIYSIRGYLPYILMRASQKESACRSACAYSLIRCRVKGTLSHCLKGWGSHSGQPCTRKT